MIKSSHALAEDAAGRLLYYCLIPAWAVPGLADWWFHRRSAIEEPENGGTNESLLHLAMLAEGSVPIGLALLAEINPLVLSLMLGAALAHEATVTWDLSIASRSQREVAPLEQQTHSLLEMVPFALVGLAWAHAWPELRKQREDQRWVIRPKRRPLPVSYVAGVALLGAGLGVVPHLEEFARCLRRARRT